MEDFFRFFFLWLEELDSDLSIRVPILGLSFRVQGSGFRVGLRAGSASSVSRSHEKERYYTVIYHKILYYMIYCTTINQNIADDVTAGELLAFAHGGYVHVQKKETGYREWLIASANL